MGPRPVFPAVLLALIFLLPSEAESAISTDTTRLPFQRPVNPPARAAQGTWWVVAEDSILASRSGPDFDDVRFLDPEGRVVPAAVIPSDSETARLTPIPGEWTLNDRGVWERRVPASPYLVVRVSGSAPEPRVSVKDEAGRVQGLVPVRWMQDEEEPGGGSRSRPDRTLVWVTPRPEVTLTVHRPSPPPSPHELQVFSARPRTRDRIPVAFRVVETRFRGRTWIADLEIPGPPVAVETIHFDFPGHLQRFPSRVEAREGQGWQTIWPGVRNRGATLPWVETEPANGVRFSATRASRLRLVVEQADPPHDPLAVTRVLSVPHRWVVAPAGGGGPLTLAYGDPFLGAGGRAPRVEAEQAAWAAASLGPEEPNPLYREPGFGLEWIRRRPGLLTGVMILLLALLGWIVLRPPSAGSPSGAGKGSARPSQETADSSQE